MKIPAFALSLAGLLTSCQSAEDLPPAPPTDIRFETSAPARLYFNNIRSTSYEVEEFPERYSKQYTLKQWPDTAATPYLVLSIVDYWLHDHAYVDLEWHGTSAEIALPWTLCISSETRQDTITLGTRHWGEQYEFAQAINQALLQNNTDLTLLGHGNNPQAIMTNDEIKRLFRLSWKDYSSLTDKNK